MKELDTIVLKQDIEEYNLKIGDMGAIVQVLKEDESYMVEFVSGDGTTIGLLTLSKDFIRPQLSKEILHVREMVS